MANCPDSRLYLNNLGFPSSVSALSTVQRNTLPLPSISIDKSLIPFEVAPSLRNPPSTTGAIVPFVNLYKE